MMFINEKKKVPLAFSERSALPLFVTKTVGTRNFPSLSRRRLKASGTGGKTVLPRTITPSISKIKPNFGFELRCCKKIINYLFKKNIKHVLIVDLESKQYMKKDKYMMRKNKSGSVLKQSLYLFFFFFFLRRGECIFVIDLDPN